MKKITSDTDLTATEQEIKKTAPNILEETGELETRQLAEKLEEKGVGDKEYVRARLIMMREYLQESTNIFTEKRKSRNPGTDTRYWRFEE